MGTIWIEWNRADLYHNIPTDKKQFTYTFNKNSFPDICKASGPPNNMCVSFIDEAQPLAIRTQSSVMVTQSDHSLICSNNLTSHSFHPHATLSVWSVRLINSGSSSVSRVSLHFDLERYGLSMHDIKCGHSFLNKAEWLISIMHPHAFTCWPIVRFTYRTIEHSVNVRGEQGNMLQPINVEPKKENMQIRFTLWLKNFTPRYFFALLAIFHMWSKPRTQLITIRLSVVGFTKCLFDRVFHCQ